MEIASAIIGVFLVVGTYFAYQQVRGNGQKRKKSVPIRDDQKANLLYGDAENHFRNSKFKDALELIDRAIELNPDDVRFHTQRAMIYLKMKQIDLAEEDCNFIVSTFKASHQTHFIFGCVKLSRDELDDALIHFQQALKMQTSYTPAHLKRQEIFLKQGELESAELEIQLLIEKFPPEHINYRSIGHNYYRYKFYSQAIKYLNPALKFTNNTRGQFSILFERAYCYQKIGEMQSAVEDYESAISLAEPNMKSEGVFINLSDLYIKNGYIQKGVEILRKSTELNPDVAMAHNAYAWWAVHIEDYASALKHAEKAISFDDQNNLYLSTRGQVKWLLRDYKGALVDYTLALENSEKLDIHYVERAVTLLRLNQVDEAITEWNKFKIQDESQIDAVSIQKKYQFAPPFYEAMQELEKLANQV